MRTTILPVFVKFHEEGTTIGRLLARYTELEIDLMNCVQNVRKDFDAVLKAMFRVRSETQRIDIADALGRHYYHDYTLGTQFEMAISSVRHCLKIRNQYAHCNWWDDNTGRLAFAYLEELANQNQLVVDLISLTAHHVDVPLLQEQEKYFIYTDDLLTWINYEGRVRDYGGWRREESHFASRQCHALPCLEYAPLSAAVGDGCRTQRTLVHIVTSHEIESVAVPRGP